LPEPTFKRSLVDDGNGGPRAHRVSSATSCG
jgi:hypothetical protein